MQNGAHHTGPADLYTAQEGELKELFSLNLRFVAVLQNEQAHYPNLQIDPGLRNDLSTLSAEDIAKIASCPYSLFDLKLSDVEWWSKILRSTHSIGTPTLVSQFTLAALTYTQRIANVRADLGGVLLGMSQPVCRLFTRTRIGTLLFISEHVATKLGVRLINDTRFWADLVNYVKEDSPTKYLATQTSALQILAAQQ